MQKEAFLTYVTDSLVRQLGREEAARRAEQEWAFVEKNNISTHFIDDDNYPARLRDFYEAPKLLYGKGNISFDGHFLSVVGTRSATDRGRQMCHDIIADLAAQVPNLTIVSGLAYGIDVTAHRAALEAGLPTIIIPAHGLDRIYPQIHRSVAVQALEKGGILTEYMSGTEPLQSNFLARNRIIAGLSEATLVVESKFKGGSLVTANHAFSNNRDVFAVPGRPSDEAAIGCNELIRRNIAGLVMSAQDIIEALSWDIKPKAKEPTLTSLFVNLTPEEEAVYNVLRLYEDGVHVNTLATEVKMSFADISALLFTMEMKGVVRSLPGAKYRPC